MGCANCKRAMDVKDPNELPPIIVADQNLLARRRDLMNLQKELDKQQREYMTQLQAQVKKKKQMPSSSKSKADDTRTVQSQPSSHLHKKQMQETRKRIRQYLVDESSLMKNTSPPSIFKGNSRSNSSDEDLVGPTTAKKKQMFQTSEQLQNQKLPYSKSKQVQLEAFEGSIEQHHRKNHFMGVKQFEQQNQEPFFNHEHYSPQMSQSEISGHTGRFCGSTSHSRRFAYLNGERDFENIFAVENQGSIDRNRIAYGQRRGFFSPQHEPGSRGSFLPEVNQLRQQQQQHPMHQNMMNTNMRATSDSIALDGWASQRLNMENRQQLQHQSSIFSKMHNQPDFNRSTQFRPQSPLRATQRDSIPYQHTMSPTNLSREGVPYPHQQTPPQYKPSQRNALMSPKQKLMAGEKMSQEMRSYYHGHVGEIQRAMQQRLREKLKSNYFQQDPSPEIQREMQSKQLQMYQESSKGSSEREQRGEKWTKQRERDHSRLIQHGFDQNENGNRQVSNLRRVATKPSSQMRSRKHDLSDLSNNDPYHADQWQSSNYDAGVSHMRSSSKRTVNKKMLRHRKWQKRGKIYNGDNQMREANRSRNRDTSTRLSYMERVQMTDKKLKDQKNDAINKGQSTSMICVSQTNLEKNIDSDTRRRSQLNQRLQDKKNRRRSRRRSNDYDNDKSQNKYEIESCKGNLLQQIDREPSSRFVSGSESEDEEASYEHEQQDFEILKGQSQQRHQYYFRDQQ